MNIDIDAVIKVLRYSSTPGADCELDCASCKYRNAEEIRDFRFYCLADEIVDGKYISYSCDFERASLDAADLLEEMSKECRT